MSADTTKSTKVQHNNQGDTLSVISGGTLECLSGSTISLAGDVTFGSATKIASLPTANGTYMVKIDTGVMTFIASVPALPSGDGDYKLNIATGVASWVAITP